MVFLQSQCPRPAHLSVAPCRVLLWLLRALFTEFTDVLCEERQKPVCATLSGLGTPHYISNALFTVVIKDWKAVLNIALFFGSSTF